MTAHNYKEPDKINIRFCAKRRMVLI